MATPWTIDIDNGAFVFGIRTAFNLRERAEFRANGELDFLETIIYLRGVVVGVAPNVAKSATDQFQAILALVEKATPVRIQLKLNGVTEYDFQPGSNIGSPRISEVAEIRGGATHATHVKFEMNIYVRTPKSEGNNVLEFVKEAEATFYNDRLISAMWHTRAQAKTVQEAKSKVIATKPNIRPLSERHYENVRDGVYETWWVYDKTKGERKIFESETVAVTKPGNFLVVDPRVKAFPAYFKGRNRPGTIVVTVEMRANKPDILIRPALHFKDGPSLHHDPTREPPENGAAIFDPTKGLWKATFTEFWFWDGQAGASVPQASHGTHKDPFPERSIPIPPGGVKLK